MGAQIQKTGEAKSVSMLHDFFNFHLSLKALRIFNIASYITLYDCNILNGALGMGLALLAELKL